MEIIIYCTERIKKSAYVSPDSFLYLQNPSKIMLSQFGDIVAFTELRFCVL